jgi:hypothetical protein
MRQDVGGYDDECGVLHECAGGNLCGRAGLGQVHWGCRTLVREWSSSLGEGLIVCFGDLKFYGALGVVWFYQGFVHDIPDLSNDISSNVLDLGSYLLIQ